MLSGGVKSLDRQPHEILGIKFGDTRLEFGGMSAEQFNHSCC